jgi:hypothetical protein
LSDEKDNDKKEFDKTSKSKLDLDKDGKPA